MYPKVRSMSEIRLQLPKLSPVANNFTLRLNGGIPRWNSLSVYVSRVMTVTRMLLRLRRPEAY